jgi:hypothetical protein
VATLAQLRPPLTHHVDILRDDADPVTDPPPIRFKLRFAGASGSNAAAEPRQGCRRTDQPRHQILQLREFDLQLAFARARAPRKNVEDELRAIDHLPL